MSLRISKFPAGGHRIQIVRDNLTTEIELSEPEFKELIRGTLSYLGSFATLSPEGAEWLDPTPTPKPVETPANASVVAISAATPGIDWTQYGNGELTGNITLSAIVTRGEYHPTGGRVKYRAVAQVFKDGRFTLIVRKLGDSDGIANEFPDLEEFVAAGYKSVG